MNGRSVRLLALAVPLLALIACQEQAPEAPAAELTTVERPIVGGSLESGWEGVGALTLMYPYYGYQGEFCTGTLISSTWILTAAHCVVEDNGQLLNPSNVRFMIGTDARPSNTVNGPRQGTLYPVVSIHAHPNYDDDSLANDIALVRLSQPISGVPTYPNSTGYPQVGTTATYVGFGATEGVGSTGSGQKRSTAFPISYVYPSQGVYTSDFNGQGTCFGDSGGPGLQNIGGSVKVVGVTSAGVSCNPNFNPNCDPDPCRRATIHTRVDFYGNWIASVTNTAAPSCTTTPSMCACAAACQANGVCNDALCQTANCSETYDCLFACGDSATCQNGCYAAASPTAQSQLDALFVCIDSNCGNATGDAYGQCVNANCASQINACFPIGTGPWTCEEVYDCIVDCATNDCALGCYEQGTAAAQTEFDDLQDCLGGCNHLSGDAFQTCASQQCGGEIDACFPVQTGSASCEQVADCIIACPDSAQACPYDCFETGTAVAQDQYIALADCADTKCGTLSGAAFNDCYATQCAAELDACFPPSNCPVTGGGCGAGEACYPTPSGKTDCYPSNGKALGTACADTSSALDCGDGTACVAGDGGAFCEAMCRTDVNCGVGRTCDAPFDAAFPTVGVCGCLDGDGDGVCESEDCDDADPATHPGAVERCDSKDNDCDGETDEGCDVCVDGDADGYCADVDCADGDPAVNPGATERCFDGVDNDCDGQTDEGCETCVDEDGDGFCFGVDCNDSDAAIYPGAVEVCGDGIDNSCDGVVDEGCDGGPVGPGPGTPGTPGSSSSSGCSSSSPAGGAALLIVAGLLLVLRRRRAPAAARAA